MSKIFDALQYAQDEPVITKEAKASYLPYPTTIPTLSKHDTPSSHMRDEMIQLKHNLTTRLSEPTKNIIQFIGSGKGEGTSTLLREFAKVFVSHSNKSVLIIDADPQHADQHQAFNLPPKIPLECIVKDGGTIDSAICQYQHSQLFLCLLCKNTPSSSSTEWLSNTSLIWEPIRKQFDLILIDSPPLSHSVDGLALCATVDGVIMVVEAEKSRSPVVHSLKDRIGKSGGNILGVVFNKQRYYIPKVIYQLL